MVNFTNNHRGKISELQEELNVIKPQMKRETIQKVIAAMTVGKDFKLSFLT